MSTRMRFSVLRNAGAWLSALTLVLVSTMLSAGPSGAQTSIKLVVNDQPITTYDVSQRARLLRLTAGLSGNAATRAAQEDLIEETLKKQTARQYGISVSQAEVDAAFAQIASRVNLSPAQLSQALQQSGASAETLKSRLEGELVWASVVRARLSESINIDQDDVVAALRERTADGADTSTEYDLQRVIFVVPGRVADDEKARRLEQARLLRGRFSDCETGLTFARGLPEVIVRPVGRRLETELTPEERDWLDGVAEGGLSTPRETTLGYEMMAICGKQAVKAEDAMRGEIELQLRNEQGTQRARQFLSEVRRNAVIIYR